MSKIAYIAQPAFRTTLDVIEDILQEDNFDGMDVAAAYVTSRGVEDLIKRISATLGSAWNDVEKRWVTSFDYCRTEPVALESLLSMSSSLVRVHDAQFCLSHGGMPRVPFHPKTFLFRSSNKLCALAGSGNLSRSGLSKGIEVGLALAVECNNSAEPTSAASMKALRNWYSKIWDDAVPLKGALLSQYTKLFESTENLKSPNPTEDDLASVDHANGALSDKDLQKLRACRHFWIDAGKLTKNRGPNLPGSQLMMKRLSRVFFGFDAKSLPENTAIGLVELTFNGGAVGSYSLTYSDNKMDKLNLPIPITTGPASYDNQFLLFRQKAGQVFDITLGAKTDKASWLKRSIAIDGAFKMSSGREWGVF